MNDNSFDAAALAGATLAATLAVLAEPGPFDWMNGIVGLTLVMIVLAYEMPRSRTFSQSAALSMVVALATLLPVSVGLELYNGGGDLDGIQVPVLVDSEGKILQVEIDTAVPASSLLWTWSLLFIVSLIVDQVIQRYRRRPVAAEMKSGGPQAPAPNPGPQPDVTADAVPHG